MTSGKIKKLFVGKSKIIRRKNQKFFVGEIQKFFVGKTKNSLYGNKKFFERKIIKFLCTWDTAYLVKYISMCFKLPNLRYEIL